MLTDELKRLKDELAEQEAKENEENAEESKESEKPESEEPPAQEEKPEEEAKPEPEKKAEEESPAPVSPESLDNAAFAKMRRENAALKKKLEEKERPVEEITEAQEQVEDPVLLAMKERHITDAAADAFRSYGEKFSRSVKDYGAVLEQYGDALAYSFKLHNPRATDIELAGLVKRSILEKAGKYYQDGLDPAQEIYEEVKALGFTGKKQEVAKEEEKEEPKPDLDRIARARARSTNMTSATGQSNGTHTLRTAANLSPAEWVRLPKSDRARILREANAG